MRARDSIKEVIKIVEEINNEDITYVLTLKKRHTIKEEQWGKGIFSLTGYIKLNCCITSEMS